MQVTNREDDPGPTFSCLAGLPSKRGLHFPQNDTGLLWGTLTMFKTMVKPASFLPVECLHSKESKIMDIFLGKMTNDFVSRVLTVRLSEVYKGSQASALSLCFGLPSFLFLTF